MRGGKEKGGELEGLEKFVYLAISLKVTFFLFPMISPYKGCENSQCIETVSLFSITKISNNGKSNRLSNRF